MTKETRIRDNVVFKLRGCGTHGLGSSLLFLPRPATQALEAKSRVLGADHHETLLSTNNLVVCLTAQGRGREAGPLLAQVLQAQTRLLGADHPDTADTAERLRKVGVDTS